MQLYQQTPISELPPECSLGKYSVDCVVLNTKEGNKYIAGYFNLETKQFIDENLVMYELGVITHWLKPVELSSLIKEKESKDNWISVEESLPEEDENVLVYSTYPSDENCRVEVAFYSTTTKSWEGTTQLFLNKITHWQKLPSPPKTK